MEKIVAGIILLTSLNLFADTLSDEIKAIGDESIKDRIEQIERVEAADCDTLKSSMEGILMALSADALSIAADATGTQNPDRRDDMGNMYRERLPKHAKELSRRLSELANAASLCLSLREQVVSE
ncbi:MAG: hypothetical protein A2381_20345 [Bdellovibrionales bacterium RIFOXYB1_FULL_37_110]|nr:MAG: hypothetical protein A2181_03980 [Bdellovibrionales bacterium RIFOXYA1_FULL_38_20]OFZ51086.1 MAG: hypothetical protein A2417_20130 [Bdellovibrionales bacterium RIFOXYC1_FULL_37_79]OFZ60298.1 MAG: hypothetical protein A2381_20345 [Bdellovibrionales bacterium RIFOXYB1_FULL_37_110]OFZ60573.1 MAG: hypothetical protein A2328_04805 [Bdellovibrionales bacterium RIFOXYB2_FULL_36_6]OFZ63293.1 MAG: hypothetical protein A2577_01660 [Bdellovibrionales bacterium RIFOXYD1_FULL_36_51]